MTPQAVIFDCDGVVVDSEGIAFDLLAEQLALYGHPMSHAEMRRLFLGGTMRSFWAEARARGIPLPDDWVAAQYDRMFAALARHTPLIPDILTVLDALDAAGIPYAMGSNGPPAKMEITLGQHAGLKDRFQGRIFSAQTLGAPKPAPDVYLHAAAALGAPPARCAVVEDSLTGLLAARAAGIPAFAFSPEADPALATTGATLFRRMADLPALLGL